MKIYEKPLMLTEKLETADVISTSNETDISGGSVDFPSQWSNTTEISVFEK